MNMTKKEQFKQSLTLEQRLEWREKIKELNHFLAQNKIPYQNGDIFFLKINNKKYLITNINLMAMFGNEIIKEDVTIIRATKLRLIEIYNDLLAGKILDKFGRPIDRNEKVKISINTPCEQFWVGNKTPEEIEIGQIFKGTEEEFNNEHTKEEVKELYSELEKESEEDVK